MRATIAKQDGRRITKMDNRNFEQNYHDLEHVSDRCSDIYGSEVCQEILNLEPYSLDILKMQLEQERFFQRIEEHSLQDLSMQNKLSRTFHEAIGTYLKEWLTRYDTEDRQGILLELLLDLEGRIHWAEEKVAAAAHLPMEQLTDLATGEVERHAIQLCAKHIEPSGREDKAHIHTSDNVAPIAAALSIAAYAEYPELRILPELIAITSSAAANTACAEKRDGAEEGAYVGAYMELMLAAASLIEWSSVPVPSAIGTECVGEENGAKSLFHAFLVLFFNDLAFLLGHQAAGIVVGIASILANLAELGPWQKSEECLGPKEYANSAEKNQESQTVEEDERDVEYEDESDDEWETD